MSWYPTQSHYPDTEEISPCLILIMLGAWLGSDKYAFLKSSVWLDQSLKLWIQIPQSSKTADGRSTHSAIPSGQWSFRPVLAFLSCSCSGFAVAPIKAFITVWCCCAIMLHTNLPKHILGPVLCWHAQRCSSKIPCPAFICAHQN